MKQRLVAVLNFSRSYASKYPRPKPGTSERPPYRPSDPLVNNPHAAVTSLPDEDLTFIHRPPPSIPSPSSFTTNPSSPLLRPRGATPADAPLPPDLHPGPLSQVRRMSPEDIAKMRQLRLSDPAKYTRGVLAKQFDCTQKFVSLVASLPKPARKAQLKKREEVHAANREKWSERHSLVKDIRAKRREFW
ncbi:hypothetical protein HGRIS_005662 [Hohenbuehelia grisea]|uniref:Uncharacterized protein n=1 Tax=Hohenbuehelia grisea TaxID=104357 RepID=A0ABR3JXI5_9AGAR